MIVPEAEINVVYYESIYPGELKPKQLIHKQQTPSSAAAITKHHRLGGLHCRYVFLTVVDVGKSKVKV